MDISSSLLFSSFLGLWLIMVCFLDDPITPPSPPKPHPVQSSWRQMKKSLLCQDAFLTFQRLVIVDPMTRQSHVWAAPSLGSEMTDRMPSASGFGFGGTFTVFFTERWEVPPAAPRQSSLMFVLVSCGHILNTSQSNLQMPICCQIHYIWACTRHYVDSQTATAVTSLHVHVLFAVLGSTSHAFAATESTFWCSQLDTLNGCHHLLHTWSFRTCHLTFTCSQTHNQEAPWHHVSSSILASYCSSTALIHLSELIVQSSFTFVAQRQFYLKGPLHSVQLLWPLTFYSGTGWIETSEIKGWASRQVNAGRIEYTRHLHTVHTVLQYIL